MAQKKEETTNQVEATSAKTSTSNLDKKAKYKLADPETSYSEHDFSLVGDQESELPEDPSAQLIQRIRHGFIVEVESK